MTGRKPEQGFGGSITPGARPVLIMVDLMRAYFDPASPMCLPSRGCLESAARILTVARECGVPVVHTQVAYQEDGRDGGIFVRKIPALQHLFGGGALSQFMPEVEPIDDELVVVKQYASAFFGTSVVSTLNAAGVDTVVIVGVSTSGCVRATAVDAIQLGFVPLVVADAVGDRESGPHEANLFDLQAKYAEVVDETTVIDYFQERR